MSPFVVRRLLYISRNVRELERSTAFYCERLGFQLSGLVHLVEPAMSALLGLAGQPLKAQRLKLGNGEIELIEVGLHGRPYPPGSRSSDLWFQHFAIRCADIDAAYRRLNRADSMSALPISISLEMQGRLGPVALPSKSGGAIAFKFRDPDGHPVELIQLKAQRNITDASVGIDHSAIAVKDVDRSIDFYQNSLGMNVIARQTNSGSEQDRLDALLNDVVDVVALAPSRVSNPHLELLGYRSPTVATLRPAALPCDIASDRLAFEFSRPARDVAAFTLSSNEGTCAETALLIDPDGHFILLQGIKEGQ